MSTRTEPYNFKCSSLGNLHRSTRPSSNHATPDPICNFVNSGYENGNVIYVGLVIDVVLIVSERKVGISGKNILVRLPRLIMDNEVNDVKFWKTCEREHDKCDSYTIWRVRSAIFWNDFDINVSKENDMVKY
jgi:hypothetical protein